MRIDHAPLAPRKGRWPKGKAARARRRRLLELATQYKRARERERYGTQGAASPCRRIDPTTGEVTELVTPHRATPKTL